MANVWQWAEKEKTCSFFWDHRIFKEKKDIFVSVVFWVSNKHKLFGFFFYCY